MPPAQRHAAAANCGKSVFGIDIKVVAEDGSDLPRDGKSQGELMVRGQWIVSGYFKSDISPLRDGWFPTGDIATIDPQGVLQIRDRVQRSDQDRRRMDQLDRFGEHRDRASVRWHPARSSGSGIPSGRSGRCCSWCASQDTIWKPGRFGVSRRAYGEVVGARAGRFSGFASGRRHRQGAEGTHLREKYGHVFD